MKRVRMFLTVAGLVAIMAAGSFAPRVARADIGPCGGCMKAQVTHESPGIDWNLSISM